MIGPRLARLSGWVSATVWAVNVGLLAAAAAWVYLDGGAPHSVEAVAELRAGSTWSDQTTALASAVVAAAATAVVMLLLLFIGPPWCRSTKAWLLFTGVVCGWLGLGILWPDLYWAGQQRRVASELAAATEFAQQLSADWPTNDGELPGVGMFLAYPKGAPTVMLLIGTAEIPGTGLWFTLVERGPGGVLRFELAGDESDAWLEWRPDGSSPETYVGGLETHYRLRRDTRLSDQWVLSRYDAGPG